MYLLYADESGSVNDPDGEFFVLAGVSIFERQTHWIDKKIEIIAQRFDNYFGGDCELHASPMRSGRGNWKHVPASERAQAVVDVINLLNNQHGGLRVFASVIEKRLFSDSNDIIPTAFQDLAFAFDHSLCILYRNNNPQRGIILFDKTADERVIQDLSRTAKYIGRNNRRLQNFAEVPVFVDSRASRLIQLADLIAYWLYRYYNHNDNRAISLIQPHFFRDGNHIIGLRERISHQTQNRLQTANDLGYPFPSPQTV